MKNDDFIMATGIIVSCIVVIICRLGYKYNTVKKIFPLDIIDYVLMLILILIILYFTLIY